MLWKKIVIEIFARNLKTSGADHNYEMLGPGSVKCEIQRCLNPRNANNSFECHLKKLKLDYDYKY